MSTAIPIIAAFDKDSELEMIITRNMCGVIVEPENNEQLKDALVD